jgi:hypothetical protein
VTFLSVAVASSSLRIPPPVVPAVLPLIVTLVSDSVHSFSIAPPFAFEWFPLNVTRVKVAVPWLYSPPPWLLAEQPAIVTSVAESVPPGSFMMPPPPSTAWLSSTRTLVRLSVAEFQMAPP